MIKARGIQPNHNMSLTSFAELATAVIITHAMMGCKMLDELPTLVMKEVVKAEGDPDAQASLVEMQARVLGMSVAIMTHDDDRATSELLEGASHYAMETATSTKRTRHLLEESIKKLGR